MEIPSELKRRLLSELDFVINKIRTEEAQVRRVYWLSAAHGAIERTTRFYLNDELLLNLNILNFQYNVIQNLLGRLAAGDISLPLPNYFWEQIIENLLELKTSIDENRTTYPVLEKINKFTFSLTGPGYYTLKYLESLETRNE